MADKRYPCIPEPERFNDSACVVPVGLKLPTVELVADWVAQAKQLPRVVQY